GKERLSFSRTQPPLRMNHNTKLWQGRRKKGSMFVKPLFGVVKPSFCHMNVLFTRERPGRNKHHCSLALPSLFYRGFLTVSSLFYGSNPVKSRGQSKKQRR